jgi:hypothetical protein
MYGLYYLKQPCFVPTFSWLKKAEVGKVTLKNNGDDALSDESL